MTKEELINNLLNSREPLNEEMFVSIEALIEYDQDSGTVVVPIDYVAGQFINVTIT